MKWKTKTGLEYVNGAITPSAAGGTGVAISKDWQDDGNPIELAFTATGLKFKVFILQDNTSPAAVLPFFGFYNAETTQFAISQNNGNEDLFTGQYQAGDRFKILKEGDKVFYYQNDNLIYTFTLTVAPLQYHAYMATGEKMDNLVFAKGPGDRQIEAPVYGSARLGQYKGGVTEGHQMLGHRNYELSNHLGNVLAVITDNAGMKPDSVWATVSSTSDYYPFGLEMEGRSYTDTTSAYRYGFNGMEKVNEIRGEENHYTSEGWEYNPSIAHRWNVDPKWQTYPSQSPYSVFNGNPILYKDPSGKSGEITIVGNVAIVSSHLIFYGSKSTCEIAEASATEIQNMYNEANASVMINGKEYCVDFKITYEVVTQADAIKMAKSNNSAKNNYIKLEDTKASTDNVSRNRSEMNIGENSGYFVTTDKLGTSTTAPHEYGHGAGLIHPADEGNSDLIGEGQPGIMAARGTLVDEPYRYSNSKETGYKGINPEKRKVIQSDITKMFKGVIIKDGKGNIGKATNKIYINSDDKSTPATDIK